MIIDRRRTKLLENDIAPKKPGTFTGTGTFTWADQIMRSRPILPARPSASAVMDAMATGRTPTPVRTITTTTITAVLPL